MKVAAIAESTDKIKLPLIYASTPATLMPTIEGMSISEDAVIIPRTMRMLSEV